jgi:hypothetical protein
MSKQFESKAKLIKYAKWFVRDRVRALRKDLSICMTAKKVKNHRTGKTIIQHAYFPGLMACIGFIDFMSGLAVGKLKSNNDKELIQYRDRFMDKTRYQHLDLVYVMLRHKMAHLTYPYVVYDTRTAKPRHNFSPRRITWTIAANRKIPIELKDYSRPQYDLKTKCPWDVDYDSRILIGIRTFQADIINSTRRYIEALESDPILRTNFEKCMNTYFST